MRIIITEKQLHEIIKGNKKGGGRVAIWNSSKTSSDELELFKQYPHYFCKFAVKFHIENILKNKLFNQLNEWCCIYFNESDLPSYQHTLKTWIVDTILNDDILSAYIHRYAQDYIAPLKQRQDYVDKMKAADQGEKVDFNQVDDRISNIAVRDKWYDNYKTFLIP